MLDLYEKRVNQDIYNDYNIRLNSLTCYGTCHHIDVEMELFDEDQHHWF